MGRKFILQWQSDMLLNTVMDLIVEACQNSYEDKQAIRLLAMTESKSGRWQLDSLATYQAASYVAMFFNIQHEMAAEQLYAKPSLVKWAELCAGHLNKQTDPAITFLTSGSTSKAKRVTHRLNTLYQEAKCWQLLFGSSKTVYSMIPTHHMYGFVWSTLLPALNGSSVMDARHVPLSTMASEQPGCIVTIPDCLPLLELMDPDITEQYKVVISGAPCDHDKLVKAASLGFKRVIQIYGSTETGGVGWRDQTQMSYRLRPDLVRRNTDIMFGQQALNMQDNLNFFDQETFEVRGRKDGIIQVKGMNVDLGDLRASVASHQQVKESAVRIHELAGSKQIHLFVVPKQHCDINTLREELLRVCRDSVQSAHIMFGHSLPVNDMGKVKNWVA